MAVTVTSKTPVISWDYGDGQGQAQVSFRVITTRGVDHNEEVLWDTGVVSGSQTQVAYGFDGNAKAIPSHETIRVTIRAFDGQDWGTSDVKEFVVSQKPYVKICTVDNKLNPTNLVNQNPVFRWQYEDTDEDALVAYELRVGDDIGNLGTDAFVGNIWKTERRIRPNPHESRFDDDSTAYPGCVFPKTLVDGAIYYFQLKVWDAYEESEWYTGSFSLNAQPEAQNLQVVPVTPFGGDSLEAFYDFVDTAGETESDRTQIRWYRNNVEVVELRNSRVVPASYAKPKQSWFFTVRPHDGEEFGPLALSPRVGISNYKPEVAVMGISPSSPRSDDGLEAKFSLEDRNDDLLTLRIRWFRNEIEQPSLRDSLRVSPDHTAVGDQWRFEIEALDPWGSRSQNKVSETVTVENSRPLIGVIRINGDVVPDGVEGQSPVITWDYEDRDSQKQSSYHVLIGTRPPESAGSSRNNSIPPSPSSNGILAVMEEIDETTGSDVENTGEVRSSESSYTRPSIDPRTPLLLGPANSVRYSNYSLEDDEATTALSLGQERGEATFEFPGETGIYEVSLEYIEEKGSRSTYRLAIGSQVIDEFTSAPGGEVRIQTFKSTRISKGASVSIIGLSAFGQGRAPFLQIRCSPTLSFEVEATDLELSGYAPAGDGTIALVGATGYARIKSPWPSGKYDVDVHYNTEDAGQPTASLQVNGTEVDSWTFETGLAERVRRISGVSISPSDSIRVLATRSGGAAGRISKIVFKPSFTGVESLREGIAYYVSLRVSDGYLLSPWYVSRFTMSGSAWKSQVSNQTGWALEFAARIFPVAQEE